MHRREYQLELTINGRKIDRVIIDSHYEERHGDSINDELILRLVKQLDGKRFEPEKELGPYEYFATDKLALDDKYYKLVWLLEKEKMYVGVVNAYRR